MALTPMMKQYLEVKDRYNDCILFFRLGDFYEMFFDDAKKASKELELVLTGRECGLEEKAPMCGIPFHASPSYISKLVSKGYKVAICEQVEDVSASKGIVKRDVVKVVTPGTFLEQNNEYLNIYVLSLYIDNEFYGLATSDISTGEFKTTYFNKNKDLLLSEISKFSPKEIIIQQDINDELYLEISKNSEALITKKDYSKFICEDFELQSQFVNFDFNNIHLASKIASSVLLKYIFDTQKTSLSNINQLDTYKVLDFLGIDFNSRRNLELTESLVYKSKKGSLLSILDKTATSMGARFLRNIIEQPLIIKSDIEKRNLGVEELYSNMFFNEDLRDILKSIYDIERISGKVSNNNLNAKDLISLKSSLSKLPEIKSKLLECKSALLKELYNNLDTLDELKDLLEVSILDEPAITIKEGNIIKSNYNKDVDELRDIRLNGKKWISSLENNERDVTGIRSLKIGYNKVFGYYIEISKANYGSIPEGRYIRKQTLSNSERYITEDLKVMEEKILGAQEKLIKLEYELFLEIRCKVEKEISRLKNSAKIVSYLDVLSTLALVAYENKYVKPVLNNDGVIDIKDGRHPVVENVISSGEFISNDTLMNTDNDRLLLITGPNMAGKSTYMRQVALITLMAQIGSFVPASYANISICDKIFTRIGASDDLAGGKSTFMVEMWEVSNILKNATNNSLVLLDEVGRGTSTYDGLSIAWSVIEYITQNTNLKCKTLFSTHYHELTKLEENLNGVKNYSVAVSEVNDEIVFLRKIIKGGADQSYGIEVAKLAGLPVEVINRAKDILSTLESKNNNKNNNKNNILKYKNEIEEIECVNKDASVTINENISTCCEKSNFNNSTSSNKEIEVNINFDDNYNNKNKFIDEIKNINFMNLTPRDAMNKLYDLIEESKKL